jgi:Uma2 family endonuclease
LSGGSTTFKRDDLLRGIGPDECYYLQNASAVRGKSEIDMSRDPPPDLAVEVDISQSSLDKLTICAALGIAEVWRYDGQSMQVFVLGRKRQYKAVARSRVLPGFPLDETNRLLGERGSTSETQLVRSFRRHVRRKGGTAP